MIFFYINFIYWVWNFVTFVSFHSSERLFSSTSGPGGMCTSIYCVEIKNLTEMKQLWCFFCINRIYVLSVSYLSWGIGFFLGQPRGRIPGVSAMHGKKGSIGHITFCRQKWYKSEIVLFLSYLSSERVFSKSDLKISREIHYYQQ